MSKRFWFPVLCLCCALLSSGESRAQAVNPQDESFAFSQGSTMPAWTVPVLRLVSATHVEPTTGVILSNTGLVLVPEAFASPGDEIIVLDGGTDLIRNGRPARLEKSFAFEGLEVLRVDGLARPGAPFAATPPKDGSQVQLTAYPPAELIAEGQPPLKIPATIVVFRENGKPSVSGQTPLPNVTGPLLDACGNLAGVSLADGIQTMDSSAATRYQWHDTLLRVLRELQLEATGSACLEPQPEAEPEAVEEPPAEEPVAEVPAAIEEPPAQEADEAAPETIEEPGAEESQEIAGQELPDLDILPPYESDIPAATEDAPTPPENEPAASGWWWLLAAAVLFGLGVVVHRLRQQGQQETPPPEGSEADPPSPAPEPGEDEPGWTPPALDSRLFIRGSLANGPDFEASCEISSKAINLVIGRGETDLRIDSAAVSRRHALLNGTAELLTLTDLGSNNGTSINGVPCLEDEIMYVEPGDIIILGDARFSIEIKPSAGEQKER